MKYRGDNDGYKKGALGKFDPPLKLNRNSPWDAKASPADLDAAAGAARKYNPSDNAGLRNKQPYEATERSRDIYNNVEKNQLDDCTGPVKFGVD